jgi:hypothetical protein
MLEQSEGPKRIVTELIGSIGIFSPSYIAGMSNFKQAMISFLLSKLSVIYHPPLILIPHFKQKYDT